VVERLQRDDRGEETQVEREKRRISFWRLASVQKGNTWTRDDGYGRTKKSEIQEKRSTPRMTARERNRERKKERQEEKERERERENAGEK
jgi:hypothetical protein